MKINLIASLIVSEYVPAEVLGNRDVPAVIGVAKKIRFPKNDKVFDLVEVKIADIVLTDDKNTQDVYRSTLRNPALTKPPIFKAVDEETDIEMAVIIWNKRAYMIRIPFSNVLDCLTGDDYAYGMVKGKKTYAYMHGKFSYNGNWKRFMATYPDLAEVCEEYDDLETITSANVYAEVPRFAEQNDAVGEVIYKEINRPSKICKAAVVVDDTAWLIYRPNVSAEFVYAKLHDILASLVDWDEKSPQPKLNQLPDPENEVQAAFDKLKGVPQPKITKLPNAYARLPHGSVRDFNSPCLTESAITQILADINPKDLVPSVCKVIKPLRLAVPEKNSGTYFASPYGCFGRFMLSEENLKLVQQWAGSEKSFVYVGPKFKVLYDKTIDANAFYVTGGDFAYYTPNMSDVEDVELPTPVTLTATSTLTETNTMENSMETQAQAQTTSIKRSDLSELENQAVDYIESTLGLRVIDITLTDIAPYPTSLDGVWTLVNAGPYSNRVMAKRAGTTPLLDNLQEGLLITTATKSFIGSDKGVFSVDTAIILPEVVEPTVVEKEVVVTRDYTNDELVEALLTAVKAGKIDAIDLIGKVTMAR